MQFPRSRSGGLKVGKKLYVGNLSFSVTDADLEDLFAPFGEVRSAQVVVDRQTGRSRGFGFVEMGADAAAQAAIDALHDQEHGGRRLTVNEAKPREDRGGGGGGAVAIEAAMPVAGEIRGHLTRMMPVKNYLFTASDQLRALLRARQLFIDLW